MSPDLRVLIVEDDPNVRLGCTQALKLAGLRVEAVESAEEALRTIEPGPPGVVVTDMRLPRRGRPRGWCSAAARSTPSCR